MGGGYSCTVVLRFTVSNLQILHSTLGGSHKSSVKCGGSLDLASASFRPMLPRLVVRLFDPFLANYWRKSSAAFRTPKQCYITYNGHESLCPKDGGDWAFVSKLKLWLSGVAPRAPHFGPSVKEYMHWSSLMLRDSFQNFHTRCHYFHYEHAVVGLPVSLRASW